METRPSTLGGMYLTDDPDDPDKWQIPTGRCDSDDHRPRRLSADLGGQNIEDQGLHAGFKLDAGGEDLALFDADGDNPDRQHGLPGAGP